MRRKSLEKPPRNQKEDVPLPHGQFTGNPPIPTLNSMPLKAPKDIMGRCEFIIINIRLSLALMIHIFIMLFFIL
jgi:hypothetical protein